MTVESSKAEGVRGEHISGYSQVSLSRVNRAEETGGDLAVLGGGSSYGGWRLGVWGGVRKGSWSDSEGEVGLMLICSD